MLYLVLYPSKASLSLLPYFFFTNFVHLYQHITRVFQTETKKYKTLFYPLKIFLNVISKCKINYITNEIGSDNTKVR